MEKTPSNAGYFAILSAVEAYEEGDNPLLLDSAEGADAGFMAATDGIAVEFSEELSASQLDEAVDSVETRFPPEWTLRDDSIAAEDGRWIYRGVTALPPVDGSIPVGRAWEIARQIVRLEGVESAVPLFAQVVPEYHHQNQKEMLEFAGPGGTLPDMECDHYHFQTLNIPGAYAHLQQNGINPGEGVTVAVVDTGYTENKEVFERLTREPQDPNTIRGVDIMDGHDPVDPLRGRFPLATPSHGTSVKSVIVSPAGKPPGSTRVGFVDGLAPAAETMPVRVTTHVVILLPNKLIPGIRAAVDAGVDVINISLGTPYGWAALRRAVQYAVDRGVIVIGASGNYWPRVVYPAAFPQVVAAAACDASRTPWNFAGAGSAVDITAPGVDVCRAFSRREGNTNTIHEEVGPSTGTTYAAACCSALAALWLSAHGGRQQIADHYGGEMACVPQAFHYLLRTTAVPHTNHHWRLKYGIGIPDAGALVSRPLPAKSEIDADQLALSERLTDLAVAANYLPSDWGRFDLDGSRGEPAREIEAILNGSLENPDINDLAGELQFHLDNRPDIWPILEKQLDSQAVSEVRRLLLEDSRLSAALRGQLEKGERYDTYTQSDYRQKTKTQPAAYAAYEPAEVQIEKPVRGRMPLDAPSRRRLRVYAFDPRSGTRLDSIDYNEVTVDVRWEDNLQPGPVGQYIKVIDIDPASGAAYEPIDLNNPHLLARDGMDPSEGIPQFHQQMVYAVAMKTIEHFERALGRPMIWSRINRENGEIKGEKYLSHLHIYPHALRKQNAYYSSKKHALLFGYFQAPKQKGRSKGEKVFTCLSYDIVAHEMTHALIHGIYQYYIEDSNEDVLAFHEAFSDIVALFQHFTHPSVLRSIIEKTRGDLAVESPLGQLATQFGQATGKRGSLRSAIGYYDENGQWQRRQPDPDLLHQPSYRSSPHRRGSILVAAVFDAFLKIYQHRSRRLIRLATGGTGILREGELTADLAAALAEEAAKTARQVLNICIRALDYLPPIDITFGEYLRAIITADRDQVPDDPLHYRVIFSESFYNWGIYPDEVLTVAPESLCWDRPSPGSSADQFALPKSLIQDLYHLLIEWEAEGDREKLFNGTQRAKIFFHRTLRNCQVRGLGDEIGIDLNKGSSFEVHTLRPATHLGEDGNFRTSIVVTLTQKDPAGNSAYRMGSTILFDLASGKIRYLIHKTGRTGRRARRTEAYQKLKMANAEMVDPYTNGARQDEPFAALHLDGI